jgi:glutathione S-transferase
MAAACTNLFTNAVTCVKSNSYVATAVAVVVAFFWLKKRFFKPQLDRPLIKAPVLNRFYLFQFGPVFDMNCSPYCLKVETYLKANGIEYEVIGDFYNLDKFSRKKFPVLQYNQEIIQDSSNIVSFVDRVTGKLVDGGLSEKDKMISTMLTSMVESELGPIVVYFRWVSPKGWAVWSKGAFVALNPLLRLFVPNLVRGSTKKQLFASGFARFPEQELLEKAKSILKAIDTQIGKSKFVLGDKFHIVDASVYGVLANIILCPVDTPLQQLAHQFDHLVTYCKTVRDYLEQKKA